MLANSHRAPTPSDINDFLECEHLMALELAAARAELIRPQGDSPGAELVRRKGHARELAYLAALKADAKEVFPVERSDGELEGPAGATNDAMRAGADVVYQAVLLDPDGWRGIADFLERVEVPSALGRWSYEVADTKLARTSKPTHLLQLAFYSEQVARIQGRCPT